MPPLEFLEQQIEVLEQRIERLLLQGKERLADRLENQVSFYREQLQELN